MSLRLYALFVWHHDDPITGTVMSVSTITEPRKEFVDYQVGDAVKARFGSFGIVPAIIGKIGDEHEKKDLEKILKTPEAFSKLIKDCMAVNDECSEVPPVRNTEKAAAKKVKKTDKPEAGKSQSVVKPKAVKRKLAVDSEVSKKAIQSDAEDRALANLVEQEIDNTAVDEQSIATSELLGESLAMVDRTGLTPRKSPRRNRPLSTCQECQAVIGQLNVVITELQNKVANLEYNTNLLWHDMEKTKSHVTQTLYTYTHHSPIQTPTRTYAAQPTPDTSLSPSPTSAFSTPTQMTADAQTAQPDEASETERTYNGFIKSQVGEEASSYADGRKATAGLFRKLFTEEETRNRSLTGGMAKDGRRRPRLEDRGKLLFLEGIIREKWPTMQLESIRQVLRDLLKPSRASLKSHTESCT